MAINSLSSSHLSFPFSLWKIIIVMIINNKIIIIIIIIKIKIIIIIEKIIRKENKYRSRKLTRNGCEKRMGRKMG